MQYDYLICPKCWDKLIEVKEDEDWQRKCSKCGTRFGFALHGKKIDDSTYHSIILEYREKLDDMRISSIRNKLKSVHLDADNLMRAISDGKQGDIIYEGDSFHTYLFAKVFSGYEPWIEFEIVPKFPYEIGEPDIFFCPECGEEADNRTEPFEDIKGWFIDGLFCRHCNKWTLGPIAKRDTTVYNLAFPYKKIKSMCAVLIRSRLVFAAAFGLTGCSSLNDGKRIVRISHAQSETHPEHLGLLKFKEYIECHRDSQKQESDSNNFYWV